MPDGVDPANPEFPSTEWRTVGFGSGDIDLPPGFYVVGSVIVEYPPSQPGGETYPYAEALAIQHGSVEPGDLSVPGWDAANGKITMEYIRPEVEELFDAVRQQLAEAYGHDEPVYYAASHIDATPES